MAEQPMTERDALERSDRLIAWMSRYIGQMAPGDYSNCYADLNEHCLYMAALRHDVDGRTD